MDWVFRYPFTSAFPTKQALEWFYSLVSKCEFHDLRYSVNFFLLYNLLTHFGRRCPRHELIPISLTARN
jgi:hypothetical protein